MERAAGTDGEENQEGEMEQENDIPYPTASLPTVSNNSES